MRSASSLMGSTKRVVVFGDDDNSKVRHSMSLSIFFGVEPDDRAARNQHVAVDDGAADARVPAHADAGHQHALFDDPVAVNAHVRAQHAAVTRLPEMMQPGEMIESSASPRRLFSANTNFAGGACG